MQDRVADVLAQRARLDRGAGAVVVVVVSLLLHAGLAGAAIYSATHSSPPKPARMVSIEFAQMPAMQKPPAAPKRAEARPALPKIEEPKPVIEEPKPVVEKPVTKPPEKNTVPLSPFGQSTKKGSETPPPPRTSNQQPATSTAPEVAIGGSGVTGLEGGDFPYSLYIQGMHRKIGSNWFRSPNTQPGTTVVIYFRILRDGTITDAKIETPSGNATFDRAALSAVRSSSPLNPLPFAFAGNYLGVHLTFR
jgi:TonB family protein